MVWSSTRRTRIRLAISINKPHKSPKSLCGKCHQSAQCNLADIADHLGVLLGLTRFLTGKHKGPNGPTPYYWCLVPEPGQGLTLVLRSASGAATAHAQRCGNSRATISQNPILGAEKSDS